MSSIKACRGLGYGAGLRAYLDPQNLLFLQGPYKSLIRVYHKNLPKSGFW